MGILYLGLPVKRHIKKHGWASLKTAWLKLLGEGAIIGIAAFLIVWMVNFIGAPYGLYSEVEAQKKKVTERSIEDVTKMSRSCTNEKEQLIQAVSRFQTEATDSKRVAAVEEGIVETLQSQNRSQQASINGCLSQAMKLLQPPVRNVSRFHIGSLQNSTRPGLFSASWILLTNVAISPVKVRAACSGTPIQDADIEILSPTGGSVGGGTSGLLPDGRYQQYIQSPVWTPNTPILATIYLAVKTVAACTFDVE